VLPFTGPIIKESYMIRPTRFTSFALIRCTIATILFVCFGLASGVQADGDDNNAPMVGYRQMLMSVVGGNMAAMGDIMKYRLVLPGHVAVHAGQMAAMAPLIAPAFKENVPTDATDAKPQIWEDWAKFESKIGDFEKAARNLEAAAKSGDAAAVGPAMKALGKSCGGCHKPFRKPEEESFKNKSENHDHDDHDDE
jgi:cytochrome c556